MNQQRMLARKLNFVSAQAGSLQRAELLFNKRAADAPHRSYANVGFHPRRAVQGVLYELVDGAEIEKMDPFEGTPRLYSRDIFTIVTAQGDIPAWVYIANEAMLADDLSPASWYLEHLLAGREFLTPEYYRALAKTPCVEC